jgi:hypothetical protein
MGDVKRSSDVRKGSETHSDLLFSSGGGAISALATTALPAVTLEATLLLVA